MKEVWADDRILTTAGEVADWDGFIDEAIARLHDQGCTCIPHISLIDGRTRTSKRHMIARHEDSCPIEDGTHDVMLSAILEI